MVTLTLNFSDEQEAWLEKAAQAAGLSIKCYCLKGIYKHFLQGASADEIESLEERFPATLLRNGCQQTLLSDPVR